MKREYNIIRKGESNQNRKGESYLIKEGGKRKISNDNGSTQVNRVTLRNKNACRGKMLAIVMTSIEVEIV